MRKILLLILILLGIQCASDSEKHPLSKYLIGKWKVASSSITPFDMSTCNDSLYSNSIMEFTTDDNFKVYQTDQSPKNCNSFERYLIQDSSQLNIVNGDAVFVYQLVKINSDSLIIRSHFHPKVLNDGMGASPTTSDSIIRRRINDEGIVIKMIKISS